MHTSIRWSPTMQETFTPKKSAPGTDYYFSSNECIRFTSVCHIVLVCTPTAFFGCVTTLNNSSVSNHHHKQNFKVTEVYYSNYSKQSISC